MLYKTRAIVLRDYELADQDKIIEIFSEKYGRIKLVAKGARKLKSKFAPTTQPLSYINILAYKSNKVDLDTLSECQLICLFPRMKKDLSRLASANYLVELVAKLTPIGEKNPRIFYLLLRSLSLLEEFPKDKVPLLIRAFELKLLRVLGYGPEPGKCINCGKKLKDINTVYFSTKRGGILCGACGEGRNVHALSKGACKTMLYLDYARLDDVRCLKVSEGVLEELEILPLLYIPYHTEQVISGHCFLREILKERKKDGRN